MEHLEKESRVLKAVSKIQNALGIDHQDVEIQIPFSVMVNAASEYIKAQVNTSLQKEWELDKKTKKLQGNQIANLKIEVTEIPGAGSAPVINIEVPVPEVNVLIPEPSPKKTEVKRNARGEITSMETK